ncbi:DNA alkylation repair protein [Marinilabiliaceae bacterium ANBcel2]|nr:DNA alkylation repair protein [Marinilabiliaceae bacterium ANBcel2]
MKFYLYDKELDCKLKMVQARIRQLMNGDTAEKINLANMRYDKVYGVSLVHLRKLADDLKRDGDGLNELAERLWFMNVRETMIIASLIVRGDKLNDRDIINWSGNIFNRELAEQFAFNLLGRREDSTGIIEKLFYGEGCWVKYCALMSLGWQFRFTKDDNTQFFVDNIDLVEDFADDKLLVNAVVQLFKMAGRYGGLKKNVEDIALRWRRSDKFELNRWGEEILFELEYM